MYGETLRGRLSVVVGNAVMAAREASHRVHVGVGQQLRPSAGVKPSADVGDLFAGVRVEVNLVVAEEVWH